MTNREAPLNLQATAQLIRDNVNRVVVGKEAVIDLLLVALLCQGHVLLEDVPGIGKTTLAKTLARSLDCRFQRIQFTPDLLPSDITGVSIFNQKIDEFEYRPGPIMAQIVLADEINRAGPRTQSALLEAMQERQVTVDGVTRPLPAPFLVLATQNPIELEGTFELPEAQLDRFLMRVKLGYPDYEEERQILRRFKTHDPLTEITAVLTAVDIQTANQQCRQVYIHPVLEEYLLNLIRTTREHEAIQLGASPRASLALYHTSQALAAINGRSFITPDDIKQLIRPVLTHRLILTSEARLRGKTAEDILTTIVEETAVPVEEIWDTAQPGT
ncbi:MAG: MoxR family ATPase [Ardenticatenaceae bacterium]|nr:MoxR family ATPase [Ardenticatenaceae bacterium]